MAFRLVMPSRIVVPVKVIPPGGREQQFELELHYRGADERRKLLDRTRPPADGGEGLTDEQVALECVCGWRGVRREDDTPITYSKAELGKALDIPYVRGPLIQAVVDELVGGLAAEKNSGAPGGTGRPAGN